VDLPKHKKMILTVKDSDKLEAIEVGRRFAKLGYTIYSTRSTCRVLNKNGVPAQYINKIEEESPNLLDLILSHEIDLIIDTPSQGVGKSKDGFIIRRNAVETGVTCLTSIDTANALLTSLEKGHKDQLTLVDVATI
jgi:carbamoyl-phosphate synthase large subunit